MDYKLIIINRRRRLPLAVTLVVLCWFIILQSSTSSINSAKQQEDDDDEEEEEESKIDTTLIEKMVKSLFSFPIRIFPPTSNDYWVKLKAFIFKQLPAQPHYFTPPNLDFRKGDDEAEVTEKEEGTGEKVKEAVVKSLDKSKSTLQHSAKSAANKLKKTLSHKHQPPSDEL